MTIKLNKKEAIIMLEALQVAEEALKTESAVKKAYALHIVRDAIAQATGRPA